MPPPLIRPPWRRYAAAAIGLGAALTAALGVVVFHRANTPFDRWVSAALHRHLSHGWQVGLLHVSDAWIPFALLVIVVVLAALKRHWALAALAVIGPPLAIAATEWVLKPAVGRAIGGTLVQLTGSYPSGHETGVTSAGLVAVIACGRLRMPRLGRVALAAGIVVWALLAAVGLVRSALHYATDTIGAVGVTAVLVPATALVIDRVSSPAGRNHPSTSRAA